MSKEKVILFGPKTGKSLLRLYPELSSVHEFKDLPAEELNFVWYYANQSSPIDPEDTDKSRAHQAAAIAFKNHPLKMRKYSEMDFSDEIKLAIKKMSTYSPDARAIAKRIAQITINNFMALIDVNIDDFKYVDSDAVEKIDWSGRNQYVTSASKINEVMPELIKKIESDGVEISEEPIFKGKKAIDQFHNT